MYLVDADGGGPLGAIQVYCDMTTAGGGWTLVYKVRNNIHHLLDPWFPMVGLGSGDAFPLTLDAPASGAFDGPVQARRETYANAIAGGSGWESRATLREGSATLFDIWTTQTDVIGAFALGRDISSTTCSGFTSATGTVIENNLGMGVTAGHTGGRLCHTVSTSAGGGPDSASYYRSNSDGTIDYSFRFYGDSSLGRNDSHTLFWVRERRPD